MNSIRLALVLFRPSILSFALTAAFSIALLFISNWSYLGQNPVFYEYLFSPNGAVTALQNAQGGMSGLWQTIVAGPFTYNVLVLVIAGIVGLGVYGFLEGFDRIATNIADTWFLKDANRSYARSLKVEAGVRLSVRVITAVLWLMYWVVFAKVVVPFCILAFRTGLTDAFTTEGTEYNLIGLGVLLLGLHIHVILLRFFTLRIRVLGVSPSLYT